VNEQELIEKARAAQMEREEKARSAEERKKQWVVLLDEQREITVAYMLIWAKKFARLAKESGCPPPVRGKYWSYGNLCIGKNGHLYHNSFAKNPDRIKKYGDFRTNSDTSGTINRLMFGSGCDPYTFSEAEMRQRVDKLFEDVLLGK